MNAPVLDCSRVTGDEPVDDLPPIDGDEDEDLHDLPVGDDFALEIGDERQDSDDSVAEELAVGELVAPLAEESWATDDAGELDIGEPALAFGEADTGRDDDDIGGAAGDDMTLGIDAIPEQGQGDAADEAVMGGGEAEVDEARFPELDSDDEADLPGELQVDDVEVAEEVALPEWADVRWERVTTPLVAVPMTCLWATKDYVVAAGDSAIELRFAQEQGPDARRLELGGVPPGEIVSVQGDHGEPSRLLLATHHGLYLSVDGGATASALTFRAPGEATVVGVTACAPHWQACYAQVSDGTLFACAHPGSTWTQLEGLGSVRAVAQDAAGSVFVLVLRDAPALLRFDTEGRWASEPLPESVAPRLRQGRPWLAVGAGLAVFGTAEGAVWRRLAETGPWSACAVAPEACAAAIVDTGAGPFAVVAVYIESEDRSYLLRIGADGTAELVGDLSPDVTMPSGIDTEDSEGMGRVSALAWDNPRGWLWVAGRFGLQAWRPVFPA